MTENWRKRFEEEDFELGTTMEGDSIEINYPKLESFISTVVQAAYTRGYAEALEAAGKVVEGFKSKLSDLDLKTFDEHQRINFRISKATEAISKLGK